MKIKFGKLERIVGRVLIAGALVAGISGCDDWDEPEPEPPVVVQPTYDNVVVSAEKPSSYSGAGEFMPRGQAEGARTWLMHTGSTANYNVKLRPNSTYSCVSRYSNDGHGDSISILFNDNKIMDFYTHDMGDWGRGWNNFADSPTVQLTTGAETNNTLSIRANHTDSYGVEMDSINLTRQK